MLIIDEGVLEAQIGVLSVFPVFLVLCNLHFLQLGVRYPPCVMVIAMNKPCFDIHMLSTCFFVFLLHMLIYLCFLMAVQSDIHVVSAFHAVCERK